MTELFSDERGNAECLAKVFWRCSAREETFCLPELADVAHEEGEQHGKVYAVGSAAGKEHEGACTLLCAHSIQQGKDRYFGQV